MKNDSSLCVVSSALSFPIERFDLLRKEEEPMSGLS
jgi:hypothetical protein